MTDTIIQPAGDDGSIPRSKMPQVDEKDILELLVFLGVEGVPISAGTKDPATCRAHQLINVERAMSIPPEVLTKPSLLSADGYIIDGDHRWYRHCVDKTMMPFIEIGLPFTDALSAIFKFPKTYEENAA